MYYPGITKGVNTPRIYKCPMTALFSRLSMGFTKFCRKRDTVMDRLSIVIVRDHCRLEALFDRVLNLRADPANLSRYQHHLVWLLTQYLSCVALTVAPRIIENVLGLEPLPKIMVYDGSRVSYTWLGCSSNVCCN
jgi:hypothetical protein